LRRRSWREREQLRAREICDAVNATPSEKRVNARRLADTKPDGQLGVALLAQPDAEVIDDRPKERQGGEPGVKAWVDLDEHRGLLEGKPEATPSYVYSDCLDRACHRRAVVNELHITRCST